MDALKLPIDQILISVKGVFLVKLIQMAKGARKIVEQCVGVRPGENVLIVTDTGSDSLIANALAIAVEAAGGKASVIISCPFKQAGEEPLKSVAAAMSAADAVIAPTSKTIFHTEATRKAAAQGTRILTLSEAKPETLMTGLIEVDFDAQKPVVDALAEQMAKANVIEIKAPGGTNLKAKLESRLPAKGTGICRSPGEVTGVSIEVYIAPIEDSTEGTFVCDASCSMIGLINEPIKITFRKGKAVSIEGGQEANKLREILEGVNDPTAYVACEIAFGLNPKARIVGDIIEDEGKYGTGHVALGNNVGFGGKNNVPLHVDMVYWKPTVWLDGKEIFRNGEILI